MKNISLNDSLCKKNSFPTVSWLLCSNVTNKYLKTAIQSCLAQTYSDFELVFVANGPEAPNVARSVREWYGYDPRVRIFITELRHLSFSLSLGLHHARGQLIARMDCDDICNLDRLERQIQFMNEHPDITVLGSSYEIIDLDGKRQRTVYLPEDNDSIRSALFWGNPLCHPSIMFRRSFILEAGGYLGGLHAEDYDLWIRLALDSRCRFANLNTPCFNYRASSEGMARRSRWAYASMASSQFRNFLIGGGFRWFLAFTVSVIKLFLRSSPVKPL